METKTSTTAPKWIAYLRRSTDKQHITLAKQERTIREAAALAGAEVLMIVAETESGRRGNAKTSAAQWQRLADTKQQSSA